MIRAESLHCPNCTAPLHVQNKQTLVACLYCNSTIRITYKDTAQPAAATRPDVSPEVVNEVKRLLVLGQRLKAVEYYAQQAQISEGDAAAAVATIYQSIAFAPPLSPVGLFLLITAFFISLVGLLGGVSLLFSWRSRPGIEPLVVLFLIVFGLINMFIFGRGLPGYILVWRGRPARATIVKSWPIRSFARDGRNPPLAHLHRFLLEIHLPNQPVYQAEANGIVTNTSLPRFQVGSRLSVKVSPSNPSHIVIIGPKE